MQPRLYGQHPVLQFQPESLEREEPSYTKEPNNFYRNGHLRDFFIGGSRADHIGDYPKDAEEDELDVQLVLQIDIGSIYFNVAREGRVPVAPIVGHGGE